MKKLKAFLIAFVLFLAFAGGLHAICLSKGMKTSDPQFGTWYSQYKDMSEHYQERYVCIRFF